MNLLQIETLAIISDIHDILADYNEDMCEDVTRQTVRILEQLMEHMNTAESFMPKPKRAPNKKKAKKEEAPVED